MNSLTAFIPVFLTSFLIHAFVIPETNFKEPGKILEFNGDEFVYPNANYFQKHQVQSMIARPESANDDFVRKQRATSSIPTHTTKTYNQKSGQSLGQNLGFNLGQSLGQSLGQNLIQSYGESSDQISEGIKKFQQQNAARAFLYRIYGLGF